MEKTEMETPEMKEEQDELPAFITVIDEDTFEIKTKDGVYTIEDVPYNKTKRARKRGEKSGSEDICLIAEFVVKVDGELKRMPEMKIGELKTSTITKIMYGINKLLKEQDL